MTDQRAGDDTAGPDIAGEREDGLQNGSGDPNSERPGTPPVQDRVSEASGSDDDDASSGGALPPSPDAV